MPDTSTHYAEPGGSAEERLQNLQSLEDGEATKVAEQPFYENVNNIMLGGDVGWATASVLDAGITAGASGSAIAGAVAVELAPVAIAIGGAWALDKLGVTDWMSRGFVHLGDELGLTIGRGDPHPACVGDSVAHSMGALGIFGGMLVGVAAGALLAAAVVATVATGGLAGALIVGACMAGGLSLGGALASASQQVGGNCGEIMTGSDDVRFEGRKVARVTDLVKCDQHSSVPQPLVEGSKTIFVNGLPLVRIGHETHCSAKVNTGRDSIWIDRTTGQYGPKTPELSAGEEFWAGLLGGLAGGAVGRVLGKGFKPKSTESAEQRGVKDEQRTCAADPVDVASGEVLEFRTDIAIPGVLPLELRRRYRTRSTDRGLLGARWSDNWSQRLTLESGRLVRFHDGAGLELGFDSPDVALDAINLRDPRYRLVGSRLEPRLLDRETRQLRFFAPLADGQTSRLERIEDLDRNAIDFAYRADGRLSSLAHSDGYRLELIYQGSHREPTRIVLHDANGNMRVLVEYEYCRGMLVEVASFQFGRFRYEYDEHGWMTRWRDSDQTDVHYVYRDDGRVVETGTRQGYYSSRFAYGDRCTKVTDADGEWIYEYDDAGLVTAETDPLGHRTRTDWLLGRVISRTDPLGRSTRYLYDERGQLDAVQNVAGQIISFAYDDAQSLVGVRLPGGGIIQLEYDHLRRLIARTEPDGTKTAYRYGQRGELLRVVQGDRETRLDYDDRLRADEITLPGGARYRRTVDVLGRVLDETDPCGRVTHYDCQDGADNPRGAVRAIRQADGSMVRVYYNSEGLPVEWVDPLGRSARRTYGPFDLLVSTVDTAGHVTRFEYDHATRLTKVINALDETYEYRYDGAGRLVAEIDWGGRTTRYERDAVGRLLATIQPDGEQWRYAYDDQGRVIGVDANDVRLVYGYDERGRLVTAEVQGDMPHVTHFAYDEAGRLIGEDQHGDLLRHAYDADGQRSLRVTPRRETQYAYNPFGALTQVGGLSIQRDDLGREIGMQAGRFVARKEYDVLGRFQKQIAGPEAAFEALRSNPLGALEQLTRHVYAYDGAGRLERVESDFDTLTYRRDERGQVTSAVGLHQPAEHYQYNAVMNLAAHGRQSPIDTHRYARGGLPEQAGHARYKYDARGRAIEKTIEQPGFRPKSWQYAWDGLNRLVKVVTPERKVWAYRYDAFNRRVAKQQIGGVEIVRFLWDGPTLAERWVERRDGTTGQAVTWHIDPGSFTPLAQETDGGLYPILTDQIGLPKVVFDSDGKAVWRPTYSVWGKLFPARRAANDSVCTEIDTTLRFPGQWADDESGLHYNLNRYYDPDSGQYLSSDPIGLQGGFRTQGYVHDPSRYFDPLGLSGCCGEGRIDPTTVEGPFSLLNQELRSVTYKQFVQHVHDTGLTEAFSRPLADVYADVYAVPKALRPEPSNYLTEEFMKAHTEKFLPGAARVDATAAFNKRYRADIEAGLPFGRPDAVFTSPASLINDLHATGNPAVMESTLGFPAGTFDAAGGMTRTYVYNPEEFGLRFARGIEGGANDYWVPGGYTINTKGGAGLPEMVTDQLPSPNVNPNIKVLQ